MTATILNDKAAFDNLLKLKSEVVLFYYREPSQKTRNMQTFKRFMQHAKNKGFICCQCDLTKWRLKEIKGDTGVVIYKKAKYYANIENIHVDEEQKFATFGQRLDNHSSECCAIL
ncbi:hypothetical protein GGI25_001988 [Coemansia spiralis]|uniref:Uncharacterized protein n=2 Tax=Coemansia TaxID=4863 RepID=A0A9W8GAW7_9FUNG|nr:hypothetical protein BX070DRAFT_236342 [Coemansia spiralis]KAJ1986676.1 hypothetical protein EDC05_006210 [Coemansia umbellata]KAJ2623244.1 hypothetical protein GGI26_002471 [Coemansia sp. RSA 1358]KAJ2678796.1 hypothetical protein GGI25_001988 [Coemansia spiralis]